jgi:hypothetical protein
MKATIACIVCLFVASLQAAEKEPTGGLADAVLNSSDLDGNWTHQTQMLFDAQANPAELFQVATNFSRGQSLSAGDIEKSVRRQQEERRNFFGTTLARLGAEAQIILEYCDCNSNSRYSIFIYRYQTVEGLEDLWKRRRESPEFNFTRLADEEIIFTRQGQMFPGGVRGSQPSIEERAGRFHIMVSPGKPEQDNPGLSLLRKQVAKLRTCCEPSIAPNGGLASPADNRGATNRPQSGTRPQ